MLISMPNSPYRVVLLTTYKDAALLAAHPFPANSPLHGCGAIVESRFIERVSVNGHFLEVKPPKAYLAEKGKPDRARPLDLTRHVKRQTTPQSLSIVVRLSPKCGLLVAVAVAKVHTAAEVLAQVKTQVMSAAERKQQSPFLFHISLL